MDKDKKPIEGQTLRRRGPIAVLADLWLAFQEKVLWPVGDGFRAFPDAVSPAFAWLGLAIRRAVIWPIGDGLALLSRPGRVLAVGGSAVAVVAIAAGAYLLTSSGTDAAPVTAAPVAVTAAPSAETSAPASAPKPAEPTLHGATPVFTPQTKGKAAAVQAPKQVNSSATAAGTGAATTSSAPSSASAATGKISSRPSTPGSVGAEISAIPGKPAGAKALAVAREFSGAFVVYETRGKNSSVGSTFADTATPELAKALLKRPPRQPADVNVPRAKVLNIVPGPSRGSVYTVSVSLLRVGVTSELRLEMEKLKGEGWRVTNVLG